MRNTGRPTGTREGEIGIQSELERFGQSVGAQLGVSPWHQITQEQVDLFAAATGDRQWIHVDPERARAGPFGGTIAHGYLTLSLLPLLLRDLVRAQDTRLAVNYGLNRVRFMAPVPVGSRIRAAAVLREVTEVPGGAVQLVLLVTVEIEGDGSKPACVAETVTRLYFSEPEDPA
jgi:acyl dehydratase